MTYNKEDINFVKNYKSKNMSNKTIAALLNKQNNKKYTEDDIVAMLNYKEDSQQFTTGYENSKLYEAAAGFIMNPQKRKKAKTIAIISLLLFLIGMLCLGIFVSWKPVVITFGVIIGIVILIVLTFFIIFKTGLADKLMDKYGF
jgi:hypothetical protein